MPLECKSSALPLELIPLVHWFYSPIFSLFPRELQLAMNIIIKKQKLENPGIDPGDSRIQIERSTTWANPLVYWFYWPIFSLFPRELQLAMNIIIKKQKLENPGIDPGASGFKSSALPLWTNPPFALILFTNLFDPRELQLAMNIIIKKQKLKYRSRWLPNTNRAPSPLCIDSIDQSFTYFLVRCN